jgi:transposase
MVTTSKSVRAVQSRRFLDSNLEAGRVRYFARAQGQRAKTDPIDAAVLLEYGAAFQPRRPPSIATQQPLPTWPTRALMLA